MRLEVGVLFEELNELNDRGFLGQSPKNTVFGKELVEVTFRKGLPLGFGKCGKDICFCNAQSCSWCHGSVPRRNGRFHQYIHIPKSPHHSFALVIPGQEDQRETPFLRLLERRITQYIYYRMHTYQLGGFRLRLFRGQYYEKRQGISPLS